MSRPIGSMGCPNLPEPWRVLWHCLRPAHHVYMRRALDRRRDARLQAQRKAKAA